MLQASILNVSSVFYMNVVSVLDVYLKCSRCLLLYVANSFICCKYCIWCFKSSLDQDVAHVAMVFQMYVSNVLFVLDVYCKGFNWMLQK
jgi:hypothetical protein